MNITFETIQKRKSVRTFEDRPMDPALKQELTAFIRSNNRGPFGTKVDFELVDLSGSGREELKNLASYGNIRGPKYFMAAAIKSSPAAVVDYGYLMENNILAATALGMGTCWVGGIFSRAGFLEKIKAKPDEVVPAVVPSGYAAKNRYAGDIASRFFVSADSRKPWKDIFFDSNPEKPLTEAAAGGFKTPLAALRLAPSASNKQPWRVIKDGEKLRIFLERTPGYWRPPLEDIQLMDIGIAMANFDAPAAGLKGAWTPDNKGMGKEGWESVAIYKGN